MRYAEFGKGKARLRKWTFLRNGHHVGYAVTVEDAEANRTKVPFAPVLECEANARKGTGTGMCGRPLDVHGQCDRAADHIGGAL